MEVGGPHVESVLGSKVGGFAGRLLARRDSTVLEMGERPSGRPSSLWAPVRGDDGAHGWFDEWCRPTVCGCGLR